MFCRSPTLDQQHYDIYPPGKLEVGLIWGCWKMTKKPVGGLPENDKQPLYVWIEQMICSIFKERQHLIRYHWVTSVWALPLLKSQVAIGDSHHMDLYVPKGFTPFYRNGSDQYHPTFVFFWWPLGIYKNSMFFFPLQFFQPTVRLWPLGVVLTRSWGVQFVSSKKTVGNVGWI